MKKLLLPLILALVGLGGGVAAGLFLQPAPAPEETMAAHGEGGGAPDGEAAHGGADIALAPQGHGAGPAAHSAEPEQDEEHAAQTEFIKLEKQFVVPIIERQKVVSLMVISMAIEVETGAGPKVFDREPKLRDEFLRVLFTHAQSGGFSGVFTDERPMDDLRASLTATARSVLGAAAKSVLLTNLVRQDLS